MLAVTTDCYARDFYGAKEEYKPGATIDVSPDEIASESRRRFPRFAQRVERTADEQLDQEMDDLASCDATADAMLAALDGQRFRDGFERPLAGVRVAASGIFGGHDVSMNDALERLTSGGVLGPS